MKILICIGSTCHLKGSKKVVARFQELIDENKLNDKIEFAGKLCMGKCGEGEGVNVSINDVIFNVKPEEVDELFKNEVLAKI